MREASEWISPFDHDNTFKRGGRTVSDNLAFKDVSDARIRK